MKTIRPDTIGSTTQMSRINEPWSAPGVRSAFKQLRLSNARYPGGTVSTYWDMREDRLLFTQLAAKPEERILNSAAMGSIEWIKQYLNDHTNDANMSDVRRNTLADLKTMADEAKPSITWVLNLVTPGEDYYERPVAMGGAGWGVLDSQAPAASATYPGGEYAGPKDSVPAWWRMMDDRYERAVNMLDRAKQMGFAIENIELGNEYHFATNVEAYSGGTIGTNQRGPFPGDGGAYAAAANEWGKRLKKRYPGAKIIAIGGEGGGQGGGAAGCMGRRGLWNSAVVAMMDKSAVDAASVHLYSGSPLQPTDNFTTLEQPIGKVLDAFRLDWEERLSCSGIKQHIVDAGLELWHTEWGPRQNDPMYSTWANALHAAYVINRYLQEGKVGQMHYHSFWGNLTDGFTQDPNPTPRILNPGRTMSVFALAMNGRTEARPLQFSDNPPLPNSGSPGLPGLMGWSFAGGTSKKSYVLVNFLGSERTVAAASVGGAGKTYYAAACNDVSTRDVPPEQQGTTNDTLVLAPYSMTVVIP